MRVIVQKAIIKVIQPQVVQYICDFCGQVCGTRENPKATWYGPGDKETHYCKKTDCKEKQLIASEESRTTKEE